MVLTEASSSCGPQPKAHPPPPIAQAPNPTGVIQDRSIQDDVSEDSFVLLASIFNSAAAAGTLSNANTRQRRTRKSPGSGCRYDVCRLPGDFSDIASWALGNIVLFVAGEACLHLRA